MTIASEQVVPDTKQALNSLRRLRWSVLLVSLPFGILSLTLPLIARQRGASALMVGGLFSISALILVVSQPFVGLGLDRFGRRPFLIGGLLSFAFSNVIFGLSSGMTGLFLAQIAQGVGSGLLFVAALTIVSDLASSGARGREFGGIEEMSFRGILLGALTGFLLLYFLDGRGSIDVLWRVIFLGFSAAAFLAAAIVWRGVPEPLPRSSDRPQERRAAPGEQAVRPARNWRPSSQLTIVLGIVFLTASAAEIISPILVKYLNDNLTGNMVVIALAFLPAALAGAVLPSRLGGWSDQVGRRLPMIGALLAGGLAALAIPFAQSLWPLALLWLFEAAAFAAAAPAEEALVVDLSGHERLGMILGLYTAVSGLGAVIGPLLGGWFSESLGSMGVFVTAASMMALGAVLILLFVREPSKTGCNK
jgi:MFS transporter, DHA1 family, multidrug resistance protein